MVFQSDKYRVRDWAAETPESIAARLEGVTSSQGQTRRTLGIMAVISMMMIIATYNAYLSYDYGWIVERSQKKALWNPNQNAVDGVLAVQALKDWASARTVSISLLGIRVSVDDSAVLGTGMLFVLSLWLVLVTRRENHTIGFLLRDTDTPRPSAQNGSSATPTIGTHGQRWLIYHSIVANSLFATLDETLTSVSSLERSSPPGRAKQAIGLLSKIGYKTISEFFYLFPVITALFVFFIDRHSYSMPDPFMPGAAIPGNEAFRSQAMWVFICFIIPLFACCIRARRYSTATQRVLLEYVQKLNEDLMRQT